MFFPNRCQPIVAQLGLRHFFSAAPSALTIFKRQIRGTRRSDSEILTSKKKKKKKLKNVFFSTKNRPTTKTWGGGTFDIVSPTCKIVGGQDPPRPPRDFRPCSRAAQQWLKSCS